MASIFSDIPSYEPIHEWTFSRKSLLIRFYLWLYEADGNSVTFCRLFWGIVCSPITFPVRLVVNVFRGIRKGLGFLGRAIDKLVSPGLGMVETLIDKREEAKKAAEKAERDRRYAEMEDESNFSFFIRHGEAAFKHLNMTPEEEAAYRIRKLEYEAEQKRAQELRIEARRLEEEESQRKEEEARLRREAAAEAARLAAQKTPLTEKIAAFFARQADKVAAWFQAHPQVGANLDSFFTVVGKVFVRGVFYPLMVAIPIAAFGGLGFLVFLHIHGLIAALSGGGGSIGSGIATAFRAAWFPITALVGGAITFMAVFTGAMYLASKAPIKEPNYYVGPVRDLRGQKKPKKNTPLRRTWRSGWNNVDAYAEAIFDKIAGGAEVGASRIWKVTAPGAKVAFHGAQKFANGTTVAGRGVKAVFKAIGSSIAFLVLGVIALFQVAGQGLATTGKFLVIAHHATKSRSCPRITILPEADQC